MRRTRPGVIGLLTIVVLSFYFLIETDALFGVFIRLFPRRRRLQVRAVAELITQKVSAWLSGQLMIAAVVGAMSAVALAALGVPYFFVLALNPEPSLRIETSAADAEVA